MTTLNVNLNLSDEVVSDVLADYFDEPAKDEILESIRDSLREGLAGKVRPVDEVLAELKQELGLHADEAYPNCFFLACIRGKATLDAISAPYALPYSTALNTIPLSNKRWMIGTK